MLTEAQKIEMPAHFLRLYETGKCDEALSYLRENCLIYPHLPKWVFDDEKVSEVAIGRHSYLSPYLSHRLQCDVQFFVSVFNKFSPYAKITLQAARDTFFMLAYAKALHGYASVATNDNIAAHFPSQDIDVELSVAQALIAEPAKWREWRLGDKQGCMQELSMAVPSLAPFCYEYAYYWGCRNSANSQRARYT